MTMPNLEEEIAKDLGVNVAVEEIQPGSPNDPFSANSAQGDPPAPSGDGGTAASGSGEEDGGQPADPNEEPEVTVETPEATPSPASDELTDEEAELLAKLEEEIREQVRAQEVKPIQSGLDKKIAALTAKIDADNAEITELRNQIREGQIANLSEDEQKRIREGWANEDKAKELDTFAGELVGYHDELDVIRLTNTYGQFGVTEDELLELEPEDREVYCLRAEVAYLKSGQTAKTQPAPAAKAAEPPAPKKPAPAGASARSDVGSDAVPPPPSQRDDGKGLDAMANNVRDGWETAAFPRSRTG